jgi:hypothetical protein
MIGERDYASFTDRPKEFHSEKRVDNSITRGLPFSRSYHVLTDVGTFPFRDCFSPT